MSVFIIEHVSKSYKVDKTNYVVLKDVNFSFPDRGLVSIVGKSGSGKSTILNLLMGIEKPTKGRVLFNGKNISKFSDKKFSNFHLSGVSIIFQHYNLFEDQSSLRNVMVPLFMKGYSRKRSKDIALKYFNKFNLDYLIYRKVKTLSGGEKQRVAIIRSLVSDTKVLLCDEPTGALDGKNSKEIMEILKIISNEKLVIMVSHNFELVTKYSDLILTLKNGELISSSKKKISRFSKTNKDEKYRYSNKWSKLFLSHNLFKNIKKNLFSIIACTLSFTAMFLSIGFINGSKKSEDEALMKNLTVNFATISKTEFIDIKNSPIQYQKLTRPSLEMVDENLPEFKSVICEENLSYLISDYTKCSFNQKLINDYAMYPILTDTIDDSLLAEGSIISDNFEEVIVNSEFAELLSTINVIGKEVVLSSESSITYSTGDPDNPFIKDSFIYSKKFIIKGVVKEFSFLNTPKIYYSYNGAKNFLKSQIMENLSMFLGKRISYFDFLEQSLSDNPVSSYSYFLFIKDSNELNRFFTRIKELKNENNEIQISSQAFDIKETYTAFIGSFSSSLIIFICIAFLGVNFILGMISLSTFIENKKNTAILTCLGSRNSSIYNLYLSENFLIVVVAYLLSIILSYFSQDKLNSILFNKFGLNGLISIPFLKWCNIQFGLVIISFLIAFVFSILFTIVPIIFYRKLSLSDELRDE